VDYERGRRDDGRYDKGAANAAERELARRYREEPAMMFLAVSHNIGDPTPYLQAEATRVAKLRQEGLLELVLLKADWSGAVLLLRTADLAAARKAVDSLPLVTHGITSFELTEVISAEVLP
jgi:hypothetical protein